LVHGQLLGTSQKSEYKAKIFAMASSSTIRLQIETALAHRIPSALTPMPRVIRPVAPTGVAAVDDLLDGGLPVGAITEMVGPECSGRTSLALSFMARITRAGSVCSWIDVSDGLDPESAAAAGVDLTRLLWVRCGVLARAVQPTSGDGFRLPEKYLVPPPVKMGLHGGGCGQHPRMEVRGLSEAVSDLLRPEALAARCAEPQPRAKPERQDFLPVSPQPAQKVNVHLRSGKPWSRIEQALRTADLLLQAGGFAAIVLDLGSIAPEHATRVPLATWFRYRAAAERTNASLLLLTQHSCAKSSVELLLRFQPGHACCDEATVFTGIEHRVEAERKRFTQAPANVVPMRKPPQRENGVNWRSQFIRAGVR
jgi:recombination protein RecA